MTALPLDGWLWLHCGPIVFCRSAAQPAFPRNTRDGEWIFGFCLGTYQGPVTSAVHHQHFVGAGGHLSDPSQVERPAHR